MTADDRIPLATRLFRPRYTGEVTFLAGELRRSGLDPQPPDARCAVELGYEAGRGRVVDRPIVRRAPRIRRVTAAGRRRVGLARALLDEPAEDLAAGHAASRTAWPERPGCRDGARAVLPILVPIDDRTLVLPVTRLRDELSAARTDYALVRSDLDLAS